MRTILGISQNETLVLPFCPHLAAIITVHAVVLRVVGDRFAGATLQVVVAVGGYCPCERSLVGCCPCGLVLATSNRLLAGGLCRSRSPLCRGPWP
ncbi:hypothetical protein BHM03_00058319 [Ensete ventricosum]|nr:hypothetical protein BHM03_00058319 [Ensete ventricosum]